MLLRFSLKCSFMLAWLEGTVELKLVLLLSVISHLENCFSFILLLISIFTTFDVQPLYII